MARSKNAPKLSWTYQICEICNEKFRFTEIEGDKKISITCKKCTYKACAFCGKLHQASGTSCSKECTIKIRERTNIERYGCVNVFQNEEIKSKSKQSIISRFGVEHQSLSKEIREKTKRTFIEKYGVENPAQADDVKEKMKRTCRARYGTDFVFQDEGFKSVAKQTLIRKYGVSSACLLTSNERRKEIANDPEVRKNFRESMVRNHGVDNPLKLKKARDACNNDESWKKRRETMRRNRSWTTSKPEDKLYEILIKKYSEVHRQVPVDRWTLDFYIPEIETYINLNGTYWHGKGKTEQELLESASRRDKVILSTMRRDAEREEWFKKNNQNFIVIWEDEIDSFLLNAFV
jgi:very-short-patch-repair endonuclease